MSFMFIEKGFGASFGSKNFVATSKQPNANVLYTIFNPLGPNNISISQDLGMPGSEPASKN
jgi:hypothetical protein